MKVKFTFILDFTTDDPDDEEKLIEEMANLPSDFNDMAGEMYGATVNDYSWDIKTKVGNAWMVYETEATR